MHRDDAYANLVLGDILREMRPARSGRGVRHRADLRHAALARHARPDHRGGRRAGRGPDRPAGPRRAAPGRLPAAAHPGAGARRGEPDRRPGALGRARARPASPTRCMRTISETHAGRVAGAARARRTTTDPVGNLAVQHNHPAVDHPGVRRGARRRPGGHRPAADRGQPAGGRAPVRPSGPGRRGRAGRRGRRGAGGLLAVRGLSQRRFAARAGGDPRRPGPRAGRGLPAGRRRAAGRAGRGPRHPLAGPVRRPGRQGRACSARSRRCAAPR